MLLNRPTMVRNDAFKMKAADSLLQGVYRSSACIDRRVGVAGIAAHARPTHKSEKKK